jgi:hypothetical protein
MVTGSLSAAQAGLMHSAMAMHRIKVCNRRICISIPEEHAAGKSAG